MSLIKRIVAGCCLAFGLSLGLAGCAAPTPHADPKEEVQARAFYDAIVAGDTAAAQSLASPPARNLITPKSVSDFQHYLPTDKPVHVTTTGVRSHKDNAGVRTLVETEYEYPGRFVILQTEFVRAPGAETEALTAFQMQAATPEEVARHKQRLKDAVTHGYIMVGLAILSFGIILLAVVELLYSRPRNWGWWLLSACIGFAKFGFNWATGAFTVSLFSINFLGLGVNLGALSVGGDPSLPLGPQMLTVSIPVFAIISLMQSGASFEHRKRVRRMKAAAALEAAATPDEI